MNDSLYWIENEINSIHQKKLFRYLTEIQTGQSPEIIIDDKKCLLFASNSYLGLSVTPEEKSPRTGT